MTSKNRAADGGGDPKSAVKTASKSKNKPGSAILDAACAEWVDLPSLTLARKLFRDNPLVWSTIDSVRMAVLYRRGRIKNKQRYRGVQNQWPSNTPNYPHNPFRLPASDERVFEPFMVEVARDTRALALMDIHFPYYNLPAVNEALRYGKKIDARMILLNGDIMDCHQVSDFDRIPTAMKMKGEVDATNQFLDALQEAFPKARIIFKTGNHEERLDRYVRNKAPEIWELKTTTIEQLLDLSGRGIDYVTDKRPIMLGKLPVIHGHEYRTPMMAPVNAARGLFLRAKNSCMQGHSHQSAEHNERDIKGTLVTTWAVACLCDLHPAYDPLARWNHGFADIELAPDGSYEVHNHRIEGGRRLN